MGEFKPMVKMDTSEPSVELKLKKGGTVRRKADGGVLNALSRSPSVGRPAMGNPAAARAMAARRKPMIAPTPTPSMGAARPMMKKGGEVESKSMHTAEMKAIKGVGKELKKHEDMPASKAHKGLKTGGIAKSTKPGEYKTGGVVNGQAGFKSGGSVPPSGIIKSKVGKTTKMVEAKPDNNSAPTGDVKMGNAGGYKKGGAAKKAFATGGAVNNAGHAVAMPKKPPSKPVAITELSGTFKRGGRVC